MPLASECPPGKVTCEVCWDFFDQNDIVYARGRSMCIWCHAKERTDEDPA
jgi:formylmethanofuran dehydrogenase subunit E